MTSFRFYNTDAGASPGRRRSAGGRAWVLVCTLWAALHSAGHAALPVEVLKPSGGLPPHVAGLFHEAAGFRAAPGGGYLVFDRRGHTVHHVAAEGGVTKIVSVGHETGRILQPIAFSSAVDGSFVVADAPARRERVQLFAFEGIRLRGFALPAGGSDPRVTLGGFVLNGVGSLQYDGERIYVNQPETGAVITEYSPAGVALRSIGRLRATGHEQDPDLHRAFNTGLPLLVPGGGFYFVFQTGEPRFRRYDAKGTLLFERAIQGREIDELLRLQPTRWPTRRVGSQEIPVVTPVVRTGAVDPAGNLWVAFTLPYIYVYDADGDRIRTVQLSATGPMTPNSLAFAPDGRLLVTPGCYWFDAHPKAHAPG